MKSLKVIGLLSLSIPAAVIISRYYHLSSPQRKQKKLKKKAKEIKNISWSELDSNLLGEILGRLCLTDQARFRAVYKNWSAAPSIVITSSSSLPWWLKFNRKTNEFEIYDTLSSFPNRLASLQNISLPKLGIPSPSSAYYIRATINQDWLFITVVIGRLFSWTNTYYFLLFSPITKKIITLPKFHQSTPFSIKPMFSSSPTSDSFAFKSSFSTLPDSPDCVFFLLDTNNASDNFALLTYRNGDKEWTARQFNPVPDFVPATCRPVYLAGTLYIVSPYGQLASFNIDTEEFKFDNLFVDDLLLQNAFSGRPCKNFTLNGELMLMFIDTLAKTNAYLPGCIRKFDWSAKDWIPVSTLGDYALFVSEKIVGVSIIRTNDRTNNGILSNKIYQVFNGRCLVYSIQGGHLVAYKSVTSNLLEDGGGLPEYKYTCGITFSSKISSTFWLEPPSVHSSNSQEVHGFSD